MDLITPGQDVRLKKVEEVIDPQRLDALLGQPHWQLMAMYQRTDQIFDGEMRLVYVFGQIGR